MASWLPWVRRRRRRLIREPLPAAWRRIVERNVPMVARLDDAARARLEGLVQLFLDEKRFEGCGGQEITDEVRLTIAAQACVLLVGLDVDDPYPDLEVIRVYPSAWRVPERERRDGPMVARGPSDQIGQSSRRGWVLLAWDAARRGAARPGDGDNVVLHEFAHQLDTEDGAADGAPVLRGPGMYGPWAEILGEAYQRLIEDVQAERPGPLDGYGATSPAEFFAVAVEAFFERPIALRAARPRLYRVLASYFEQDPAGR